MHLDEKQKNYEEFFVSFFNIFNIYLQAILMGNRLYVRKNPISRLVVNL